MFIQDVDTNILCIPYFFFSVHMHWYIGVYDIKQHGKFQEIKTVFISIQTKRKQILQHQ